MLPPTKHPSLLLFDGGGVRGVITLGFMLALEKSLGLKYPVQEHFDLVVGTSAGLQWPNSKWHSQS
jgi:patatin-like phospholipase/acyl hydrolase